MEKIQVTVGLPMAEEHLARVKAIDLRLEVTYVAAQLRAELGIAPSAELPVLHPIQQPEFTQKEAREDFDRILPHTEIYLGWRFPPKFLSRAPKLKWVQWIGSGLDLLSRVGLMDSDIVLTHAHGVTTVAVAEHAFCLMMALARQVPRWISQQRARQWQPFVCPGLDGKTLGIVGLGRIGTRLAGLARPFGMRVLGTEKRVPRKTRGVFEVDTAFSADALLDMLAECDFVTLCSPLTSETKGLIGEAALRAMKPTAYLINISRGPIIQERVLVRALKEGWIAGAGMDVFEDEPLVPGSELWEMQSVIVSAHSAPYTERHIGLLTGLFCENLKRYLNGQELINLVDKSIGR